MMQGLMHKTVEKARVIKTIGLIISILAIKILLSHSSHIAFHYARPFQFHVNGQTDAIITLKSFKRF